MIVDHLQHTVDNRTACIAFCYCSYKEQAIQSASNVIGSFVQQFARKHTKASEDLIQLYREHQKTNTRPKLEEFRTLLASRLSKYSKTFIVLDALDETDEKNRVKLISELKRLPENVKVLVTSRHCTSDEEYFEPSSRIEILAPNDDIITYVEARMVEDGSRLTKHFKTEPRLEHLVLQNVVKQAQGM